MRSEGSGNFFRHFPKGEESSRQLSRVPPEKTQQEHNLFPQIYNNMNAEDV